MSLNKNNISFFLCFISSVVGFSQQYKKHQDSIRTEKLDEIVITATRTIRQLSSLPMPVSIVSKSTIQKSNSVRLADILNEQVGLTTVPDFGGGEGIQLQGLDSQYTLILIDGVPLIGRSAGTLDLNRISVGNIKQIEIVKGASSSLYGSEALGGVINIITENPKYGFKGDVNYRTGSFAANDFSATASYKKNKFGISTFFNRYSSNGYDLVDGDNLNTVDPFANYTFNTKVSYEIAKNTKFLFSGRVFTQNQDVKASQKLQGKSNINEWNTRFKFTTKHNKQWKSLLEIYASRYKANEYLDNTDGSRFSDSYFNQFLVRPEIRTFIDINKNTLTAGFGINHQTLDRTDFSQKPEFNSPYVFAQYDINPTEKLNLIVGARYDSHNKYRSQFSPKFAANYQVNRKLSVKGSVGAGFKAPDFRQLYFNFTNATVGYTVLGYNAVIDAITLLNSQGQIANILVPLSEFSNALNPESSLSINIGSKYKLSSSVKLELNLFRNNIKNLIDTKIIANKNNGQNVFSYFNVNNVYTQGLEVSTTWKPTNNLKVLAGYQLLLAKDKEAERKFKEGKVFARPTPSSPSFQLTKRDYFGLYNRSKHMANLNVFYDIPAWKLDANIRTTYRSKYGLFDSNGNNYLDSYDNFVNGYVIVDLALNKNLYKNYTFGFGIDNVFGFTDRQNISNIPGRILYGKLNIQF